MSDLYQQLDNNRKVNPRTQDGFHSATFSHERSYNSSAEPISHQEKKPTSDSFDNLVSEDEIAKATTPDYLVETAKSKLLTLEVSLRQQLEQHLFDNPDISWDTFIESALILCFKSQSQTQRATKLAVERLQDRKRSAVYKRTQTMAKKFI